MSSSLVWCVDEEPGCREKERLPAGLAKTIGDAGYAVLASSQTINHNQTRDDIDADPGFARWSVFEENFRRPVRGRPQCGTSIYD